MQLEFLGNGGSGGGGCPTLLASDADTYIVQGWETDDPSTVEIPHLLLGFAKPDTFVCRASDFVAEPISCGFDQSRSLIVHGETAGGA
ncbi:hypothetical protein ACFYTF_29775, partial [Nocardia thailandica]